MTAPDIPEGFERHFRQSPLTDPWEPLYSKRTDKAVIIGLRLARAHTNARGLIHGGLIAALADNAMGHSCALQIGGTSSLVTIGLAVDFVGSAKIGQWLTVESDVIRTGSTICFAQSLVKADDAVIARANATFRVVPKREEPASTSAVMPRESGASSTPRPS
nr:PaaI family thioesterase [Bradyrhizobium sp. dw_78]